MSTFTFEAKRGYYTRRLMEMNLNPRDEGRITAAAKLCLKGKARYQEVERLTGVPWQFIAVLHYREKTCNFAGVLHNGEKIIGTGRKTTLVPAGRGPFSSWEEAAVDALRIKGLVGKPKEFWAPPERFAYEAERFNGAGYHNKGRPSPYLWSGSNQYSSGKYVRDHIYDPAEVDKQLGVLPIMLRLRELEGKAGPEPKPEPVEKVGLLRILLVWLKYLFGALASIFSLDNLTSVREWLGVVGEYFPTKLLAGALLGAAALWLFTQLLERAKHKEVIEEDDEGQKENE
jgi:lysozyme family protein